MEDQKLLKHLPPNRFFLLIQQGFNALCRIRETFLGFFAPKFRKQTFVDQKYLGESIKEFANSCHLLPMFESGECFECAFFRKLPSQKLTQPLKIGKMKVHFQVLSYFWGGYCLTLVTFSNIFALLCTPFWDVLKGHLSPM